jgi:competence protein ComEC
MQAPVLYIWKQAPFLRHIIPFMAGIVAAWYSGLPVLSAWIMIAAGISWLILFNMRTGFLQFRLGWINGICIHALLFSLGVIITHYKDIARHPAWINKYYHDKNFVVATLEEPLSEKTKSFKAIASVQELIDDTGTRTVKGSIICYFQKDSSLQQLSYGSRIIFNKQLQPIKNAGNPAGFQYRQYAAFQDIYQQVFLKPGEYRVLPGKNENGFTKTLFHTREKVLRVITTCIPGEKESGLAEALLIGYKDDLDKTLVQSYSNTGVVHVIAISGLHLGLIYWLLDLLLKPLQKKKRIPWLPPVLIITGLWLFAMLAGGGPSILRSAVMFTGIVIAQSIKRKTFIYNSLAASAFIVLCINPFWLWDAGFQLSYTAVLSIVIFMRPIYNWMYCKNKSLDAIWKLNAVTLAAQILTTPVSMYHFHQFPNYFLFTNILAVPLSSCIVLGEIFLCCIAWIPAIARLTGILLHKLIWCMNSFIEHMESMPFALWGGMQINIAQIIFLYAAIIATAFWLLQKNKSALIACLCCILGFIIVRTASFIEAVQQQKLVVYNIPQHQAIDFIYGQSCFFKTDDALLKDDLLQNFNLKPARTLYRISSSDTIPPAFNLSGYFVFGNKTIIVIDDSWQYHPAAERINADVIIISQNPRLSIEELLLVFNCRQLVLDASNPPWKVNKWKADCQKLRLACHPVVDNGAFVMNMD